MPIPAYNELARSNYSVYCQTGARLFAMTDVAVMLWLRETWIVYSTLLDNVSKVFSDL